MQETYILKNVPLDVDSSSFNVAFKKITNIKKCHVDLDSSRLVIDYVEEPLPLHKLNKILKKEVDKNIIIEYLSNKQSNKEKIIGGEEIFLIIRVLIATILLIIAWSYLSNLTLFPWYVSFIVSLIAWLIVSYDTIFEIVLTVVHKENPIDENLLMLLASVGAFAIQEYHEGCLVMILKQIGELFEHISLHRSKNAIVDATDLRAKTANILKDGALTTVRAEDVKIGDIIVVKVGEVFPCDGEIIEGEGRVNTSSLTGESYPRSVKIGDETLSGYVLESGSITLRVNKAYEDSAISKVIELVTKSNENKSKTETFISKFAKIYTPVVTLLALLVLLIGGGVTGNWVDWTYNALNFLVIGCPCSIVISIPLAYFTGIGLASKNGVVVKGGNYLDALNAMQTLYYDKTGTITQGKFSLVRYEFVNMEEKEFLETIYRIERRSNHPIAKAIIDDLKLNIKSDFKGKSDELAGYGMVANYKGKETLIGSKKLMEKYHISLPVVESKGTIIYLAIEGQYRGYLVLDDKLKMDAKEFVEGLYDNYVRGVMLTGDLDKSASRVANELGIKYYHSELLPEDKLKYVEDDIKENPKKVVGFMGDGVNDAPCIARANVGIAMGGLGSDVTVENADVVIMDDKPTRVNDAIKVARATRLRAIVDILVSLIVKVTIMILSLFGLVPMWVAVLCDTGLSVILIVYSVLLIKKKIHKKKQIFVE